MLSESLSMKLIPTDLEKNKILELKTKINSKWQHTDLNNVVM